MDVTLCNQLAKCVEELTSSGLQVLDSNILKQVKKICKTSDEYVEHTYHLIKHQLDAEHAEVRLGALLLCDQLFRRSHRFRELLVADFQEFLEQTVETDPDQQLPPPVAVAKKLRRTALDFVQQWHSKYSDGYRKLALGYNFLKECKKVDFRDVQVSSIAERHHVEANLRRKEKAHSERLERLNSEMTEMRIEIDGCLSQITECFRLITPEQLRLFDDVDFGTSRPCCSKSLPDAADEDASEDWAREHGLIGGNYNLTVNVPATEDLKVRLTTDNVAVMENLRDLRQTVATRYLPAVTKWTRVIAKCSGPADQLKKTIDLKNTLERTLERCAQLGVDSGSSEVAVPSDDDDDDDDFEEVESKEGLELVIPQNRRAEYGLEPLAADDRPESLQAEMNRNWKLSLAADQKTSDERQDPTSLVANVKHIEDKIFNDRLALPSTSGITKVDDRKAELLAKAPKLRFDADLVNWGEKDVTDPSIVIKRDSLHQIWIPFSDDDTELRRKDGVSRHSRVSEFTGNFEPVKWKCRAPMPSGRLCPRQDRHKCPLHGSIVPRDSSGMPTDPKDRERLQRIEEEKRQANPDWQDPALLADIKAATGVDLTITKRRKKKAGKSVKRKKHPGLTDLKAVQSTSRSRFLRSTRIATRSTAFQSHSKITNFRLEACHVILARSHLLGDFSECRLQSRVKTVDFNRRRICYTRTIVVGDIETLSEKFLPDCGIRRRDAPVIRMGSGRQADDEGP